MKKSKILFLVIVFLSACSQFDSTVVATNTPEDLSRKIPQITDVNRYSEILDSFENSPLVEHFPKTIPPEATRVLC
jgi:PBP1b-binding outer membrane lipoprotein LpoB